MFERPIVRLDNSSLAAFIIAITVFQLVHRSSINRRYSFVDDYINRMFRASFARLEVFFYSISSIAASNVSVKHSNFIALLKV